MGELVKNGRFMEIGAIAAEVRPSKIVGNNDEDIGLYDGFGLYLMEVIECRDENADL